MILTNGKVVKIMSEQHSKLGYSAVSTFENCPYQYKLRYVDKVEMLDEYEPTDALKIGTALHRGIETDVKTAIQEYYNSYPVISDLHINEAIKDDMDNRRWAAEDLAFEAYREEKVFGGK